MTFSLPAERLDSRGRRPPARNRAYGAKIKGFRPGKVPTKVIEQRFGQQVRAEVLDGLLREGFDNAVREQSLQPRRQPADRAGRAAAKARLAYVATFEVVPDFGDIDVAKLNVIRHTAEVEDADIDAMIENLRLQRRSWNPVERAAQDGDAGRDRNLVAGRRRAPAGGRRRAAAPPCSAPARCSRRSKPPLVGMKAGEEKTVEVDFPADWRVPQFAGRKVAGAPEGHQGVRAGAAGSRRRLHQELRRASSGEPEQFRADIRSNLERELKGALMNRLRREVGEQLIAAYAHVEMPPRLVENEARDMAAPGRRAGPPPGPAIAEVPADAHQGFMDPARKRVLVGLLVGEIARRNELRLDPAPRQRDPAADRLDLRGAAAGH